MGKRIGGNLNAGDVFHGNSLRGAFLTLGMGAIVFFAPLSLNAQADEQTPAKHDMHDMQGMDMKEMDMKGMDMEHMDHMDHAAHKKMLEKRGTYLTSPANYNVPDITLVDTNGHNVSLREQLNDRSAIILNFIYTTCTTICPVMSATFQQVQEQLGADQKGVRLVSISIDPENDTPAKLKAYASKFQAGPQWTMLTGSLENSLITQKAFGVFAGEKMNHKSVTFLKAKGEKNTWIRIDGLAESGQIVDELEKLNPEKKTK